MIAQPVAIPDLPQDLRTIECHSDQICMALCPVEEKKGIINVYINLIYIYIYPNITNSNGSVTLQTKLFVNVICMCMFIF